MSIPKERDFPAALVISLQQNYIYSIKLIIKPSKRNYCMYYICVLYVSSTISLTNKPTCSELHWLSKLLLDERTYSRQFSQQSLIHVHRNTHKYRRMNKVKKKKEKNVFEVVDSWFSWTVKCNVSI